MTDPFSPADKPLPWHRGPNESGKAYAALVVYLRLGADHRSLAKASQELGKSKTLLDRWSSKHSWVERTQLYDTWVTEQDDIVLAKQRRNTARRLGAIASVGLNLVTTALLDIQRTIGEKPLGPMQVSRLLEACSRASVVANGGRPVDAERPTALIVNVSLQKQPRYEKGAEGIRDDDVKFYRETPGTEPN